MGLFKRGAIWFASFWEEGKRVKRSTHCTDRRAAEAVAGRLERRGADPVHAARQDATVGEAVSLLLARFEKSLAAGKKSPATKRFYLQKLGHLVRIWGAETKLARLLPADGDRYVDERRAEGASDHTIHKELCKVRQALRAAKRAGKFEGDVEELVPRVEPGYQARKRAFDRAELDGVLGALLPAHAAWVALSVATGARLGEVSRARREDVTARVVRLRGTKTKASARTVPLLFGWQRELAAYALEHAPGPDRLFPGGWGKMHRDLASACSRAGVPTASANDLRRTAATWLRNEGLSQSTVAEFLGHTSASLLARGVYDRRDVDDLALRAAKESGAKWDTGGTHGAAREQIRENEQTEKTEKPREFARPRGFEPLTRGLEGQKPKAKTAIDIAMLRAHAGTIGTPAGHLVRFARKAAADAEHDERIVAAFRACLDAALAGDEARYLAHAIPLTRELAR